MADINVTPLVDVMLVLLIIFMVTAPLMTSGVPVKLPDSRARAIEQDQKPVQVVVQTDGTVYVDNKVVSRAALPDRLAAIAARRTEGEKPPQVQLRADGALDYAHVMDVMGELSRAGLNRVSLVTNAKTAP